MRIDGLLRCIAVVPIAVLMAACGVPQEQHQEALDKLAASERAQADLGGERDELAAKLAATEAEKQSQQAASEEELAALRQQREQAQEQLQEFQSLAEALKDMVAAEGIEVYRRRGRIMVGLPSSVLFPSGKAELSERGQKALTEVASQLQDFRNRRFIVAGHTDNIPVSEDNEFRDNWELSSARALTVTRFLVEQGMPPRSLAAAGYSEYDPVRTNKTTRGRRVNRRIELILEPRIPKVDVGKLDELVQPESEAEARPNQKRRRRRGK